MNLYPSFLANLRLIFPGLIASGVIAIAAPFLSLQVPCPPCIELAARHLLRLGVALLGLRPLLVVVLALLTFGVGEMHG